MDLKQRLRRYPYQMTSVHHEAAQEIERLEKTVLRLMSEVGRADQNLAIAVEALEKIAKENLGEYGCYYTNRTNIKRARAVLAKIKETK